MRGMRRARVSRPVERYLVPLDFAPGAQRALERVMYLGAARYSEIHLLHVLAPEVSVEAGKRAERALGRAQARLAEAAGARSVHSQMRSGAPYLQIIQRARELGAELIVMGRNRPPGVLGTTLTRVVQLSEIPTLVVRRRAHGPYRRPLVAVEIDPSARNLIELTAQLLAGADREQRLVRLVHAYRTAFAAWHRATADASRAFYTRQSRQAAERSLAQLLAALGPLPCVLEPCVRQGDPRAVIAREASRVRADLVAVGTHGRGGVAHALLGSIAEWAVANISRDVLIARPVRFTFVPP